SGIPGGAAVAGIMADILVQQHGAGHAGAGKALVVAFAVAGPLAGIVAEIHHAGGGNRRIRPVLAADIAQPAGAPARQAVAGVMGDVGVQQVGGGHALALEAGIVAFAVIGPVAGIVAEGDAVLEDAILPLLGPQRDQPLREDGLTVAGIMADMVVAGRAHAHA